METVIGVLGEVIACAAEVGVLLAEAIGVVMLIVELVRATVAYVKGNKHAHHIVSHGINNALSFLLVGEVLHTVHSEDQHALLTLGLVILLRVAITVLLWWESKHPHED